MQLESVYSVSRALSGTPLQDSYHLGSTVVNDFGRPSRDGLSSYTGVSGSLSWNRFVLYARGEFQGSPSAPGYSSTWPRISIRSAARPYYLNSSVPIPYNAQTTIPAGPLSNVTEGRWIEAYISAHVLNNEISFGKQDHLAQAVGYSGGMAMSNDAREPVFLSNQSRRTADHSVPLSAYRPVSL